MIGSQVKKMTKAVRVREEGITFSHEVSLVRATRVLGIRIAKYVLEMRMSKFAVLQMLGIIEENDISSTTSI